MTLAPVIARINPDGWVRLPSNAPVTMAARDLRPGDLVTFTTRITSGGETDHITGIVDSVHEHDAWWKAAGSCDLRVYLVGDDVPPMDVSAEQMVAVHRRPRA